MATPYVHRTYTTTGTPETVSRGLHERLISAGFADSGTVDGVMSFRYPTLTFSSAKPLTCVSRLTVAVDGAGNGSSVRIGITFTKIRYYTIIIFGIICFVLPAAMSYVEHGIPEIPLPSYLGLPLGVMVHYHVRWRVFSTFRRLIQHVGG